MPSKVVIITGGAKGIGAATAEEFVRSGWRVAILDLACDERPNVPCDESMRWSTMPEFRAGLRLKKWMSKCGEKYWKRISSGVCIA